MHPVPITLYQLRNSDDERLIEPATPSEDGTFRGWKTSFDLPLLTLQDCRRELTVALDAAVEASCRSVCIFHCIQSPCRLLHVYRFNRVPATYADGDTIQGSSISLTGNPETQAVDWSHKGATQLDASLGTRQWSGCLSLACCQSRTPDSAGGSSVATEYVDTDDVTVAPE